MPRAEWHALTHVSASKLGGAPRVKLSLRFMTNEPAGDNSLFMLAICKSTSHCTKALHQVKCSRRPAKIYCLNFCQPAHNINALLSHVFDHDSGNATDLGWKARDLQSNAQAQGEKRFQGSNSVLKSALQKNVRLCRPAEAVRYITPKIALSISPPDNMSLVSLNLFGLNILHWLVLTCDA